MQGRKAIIAALRGFHRINNDRGPGPWRTPMAPRLRQEDLLVAMRGRRRHLTAVQPLQDQQEVREDRWDTLLRRATLPPLIMKWLRGQKESLVPRSALLLVSRQERITAVLQEQRDYIKQYNKILAGMASQTMTWTAA